MASPKLIKCSLKVQSVILATLALIMLSFIEVGHAFAHPK